MDDFELLDMLFCKKVYDELQEEADETEDICDNWYDEEPEGDSEPDEFNNTISEIEELLQELKRMINEI